MNPKRQAEIDALRLLELLEFELPAAITEELQARLQQIKNGEDPYKRDGE